MRCIAPLVTGKHIDMGWGLDLWDKENEIKACVDDGFKFIEKAKAFAFEMSKLESGFSQQVKKLVRAYFPQTPDDVYTQDRAYRVCWVDPHFNPTLSQRGI